jgi:hypothetical protein
MRYILGLGILPNETDVIEEAIRSFILATEGEEEFSKTRVRKNYTFDKETIDAMGSLIKSNMVRNENEAIDLAMEWFATIYRMRESAAAMPIPKEKDLNVGEVRMKSDRAALAK